MQFIVESQAKAEIRTDAMEKRLDKGMHGIVKILGQGMRMLAKTETRLAELAAAQKELAASQKETDRSLKALINSMRNGRNGR